ncbi:MAG: PEGA domain-containing protein [Fibrobacterales bacterium]
MHRTLLIPLLLVTLLVHALFAEEPTATEKLNQLKKRTPTIAIFTLENSNRQSNDNGYGEAITSMLNTHLRNETNFMVLERSQLKTVIDEKALKQLGVTRETRSKLQKLHSVEVILSGEVSLINGLIQIDTRLISTETGQVVVAEYATVKNVDNLRAIVSDLAKTIEIKYLRQWMGNLKITAYPVEGEVYLDDQFIGKTEKGSGLNIPNLLEGSYKLKVMAGGYKSHEGVIEIKPRTNRDIQVILETLPGKLSILSEPVGAEVYLNNKKAGVTPLSLNTLEEGKYEVQLRKTNFQVWSEKINIQSGQLSEIKGLMEVIPGEISVESMPSNALVYLDDVKIGLTPLVIQNKKPGTSVIRIKKGTYQEHKEQITIKPGETTIVSTDLKKQKGKLTLVSGQAAVTANVSTATGDSILLGTALPVHKNSLDIGVYVISLHKQGYFTFTDTIVINADRELRIEKELIEKPAIVTFTNNGETAIDLFIDGEYHGNLITTEIELARGEHSITLSSIYTTEKEVITVDRDERRTIEVEHTEKRSHFWTIPASIIALLSFIFIGGSL